MEIEEEVILVDEQDHETGTMEKMEAHRKGLLHRAFSVFIFNSRGEMLLQRRSMAKYHSGGLWTNACCSHPRPGEGTGEAAQRRLMEEMGLNTDLEFRTSFVYRAQFTNGLTEHEFDHVYTGKSDLDPVVNPDEVDEFMWRDPEVIKEMIRTQPGQFSYWFRVAMDKIF